MAINRTLPKLLVGAAAEQDVAVVVCVGFVVAFRSVLVVTARNAMVDVDSWVDDESFVGVAGLAEGVSSVFGVSYGWSDIDEVRQDSAVGF